jgi:hypothetical protein
VVREDRAESYEGLGAEHPDSATKRPAERAPCQVRQAVQKGGQGSTRTHAQGGEPQAGPVQGDVRPSENSKGVDVGSEWHHILAAALATLVPIEPVRGCLAAISS